jgi:hypothetical protein
MRKNLLILFFSVISIGVFSQTTPWINPGAVWYYKWDAIWVVGNDKIEYTHDTIIYGKTCQVLKNTSNTYLTSSSSPVSTSISYHYTYNSGDTVFHFVDSTFHVLYDFGAQPGDYWDLNTDFNYSNCHRSIVHVDSVSSIIFSGNSHRVLFVSDSSSSNSVGFSGRIIEHIGSMVSLFPIYRECDTSAVYDGGPSSFSCFSDALENFSVVPPDECENPWHVVIKDQNQIKEYFTISPNPSSDLITLTYSKDSNMLSVYNTLGELLFQKTTIEKINQIDISDFASGVYIVQLKGRDEIILMKRFVKK